MPLARVNAVVGRFFGAVKTTGIYCRPVCPARTPLRRNMVFYPSAAAAEIAGFRPCLRCRPETAPDMGAWRGTSNTVSRALALIDAGALDGGPDGLEPFRIMLPQASERLKLGGLALLEIGWQQAEAVAALAGESFPDAAVAVHKDFAGHNRIVAIQANG